MEIAVTGGAGFIGGHLAETFVRNGHDVTVLDNFRPYYDRGIKEHNVESARAAAADGDGSYELVRGDVRDSATVQSVVEGTRVVFHQAAQAGVRTSVEEPVEVTDINVVGTLEILEAARDTDTERVVIAGSSSVYGKPEYLPYDEEHPTEPVSPYGVSKLSTDHYARVYHELFDLSTVVLRYFTVYGPRMRPNMAISNFVSRCTNGEPPVVYGDGTQTRDLTYIGDIVDVNQTLLSTNAADGEIVNVGSTDNIEIVELAREIRDQIDPNLELTFDERHEADAEHTHADTSKAAELLDYEPSYTIRQGIAEFVDWYEQNRDWYEPLVQNS
ncbi:GDP-mannose 4,6-dehydratase [Halobaculum sp. MBLA0147]|uniref:GDP-mannose 4,6-dehydratase n=1 Tax=Halobaculum sp. MBLA0147 TaxID=3079934 RepID=UPI0035239D42